MPDEDPIDTYWRSFYLGIRVAIHVLEVPDRERQEKMNQCLQALGQIADKDMTLNDPTSHSTAFPAMAETFQRMGNTSIHADRELAVEIREGLNRATDVPE